jgi:hypothetical protein
MRHWRQLAMIAPVAAGLFALATTAAGEASARALPGHPEAVGIVRGNGVGAGEPGTVETVTFGGSRTAPVRVVRGGAGWSAAALAQDRVVPAPSQRRAPGETLVAFADPHQLAVTVLRGSVAEIPDTKLSAPAGAFELDRVAFAVDGAESSHGTDPRMWRPELDGPQGPMQVSAAAALDLGGGDRFDLDENRALGRAYLLHLYHRYGNWPDAVAAYNWGPGNLDAWIAGGRPALGLPLEVAQYRDRVLHEVELAAPPASGRDK